MVGVQYVVVYGWLACIQPNIVFTAVRTTALSQATKVPITFNNVVANVGAGFQNPYFKAPMSGIYEFDLNFEYTFGTKPVYLELVVKEKVVMRRSLTNECDCNGAIFETKINVHLVHGDSVYLRIDGDPKNVGGAYHIFSGHLISKD